MRQNSFKGFKIIIDGRDFRPISEANLINKKINPTKRFNIIIKQLCKLVKENFKKQERITRKNLNPEKYKKAEIIEKLDQVKGTLEEKQKDLVEAKKELSSSKTISKTEKKRLEMKINCLQMEIVELRKNRDTMLSDFSYSHYSMKSGKDAACNMDYQKSSNGMPNHGENSQQGFSGLKCVDDRLKKYNSSIFNEDRRQDNRRGEQLR